MLKGGGGGGGLHEHLGLYGLFGVFSLIDLSIKISSFLCHVKSIDVINHYVICQFNFFFFSPTKLLFKPICRKRTRLYEWS